MYKIIFTLFIILSCSGFSQTNVQNISQIEVLDSSLIGMKIKKVMELFDIGNNWTVIQEPPGIVRGIWINETENYQIQFITKRTVLNEVSNKRTRQLINSKILNLKIIGISWSSDKACKSLGEYIPQFAFDKWGPCE